MEVMDHCDGDDEIRYVKNTVGTSQEGNCTDSVSRQGGLRGADGDNVIVINDFTEDIDIHVASWRCTDCSTVNPASIVQCRTCLTVRMPDGLLRDSAKRGAGKYSAAEDGKDVAMKDDEVWTCCRCTLQNAAESRRCGVCEAPRRSTNFRSCAVDSVTVPLQPHTDGEVVDIVRTDDKGAKTVDLCQIVDNSASEGDVLNKSWDVWSCSNCTYNNNPSWAKVCDVCETEKHANGSAQKRAGVTGTKLGRNKEKAAARWQCVQCSMMNADSVDKCKRCGVLHSVTAGTGSVEDVWTCTKCTLKNSSQARTCAACFNKRNTIVPRETNDSGLKWSCPMCTCMNDSSQNLCQACRHQRLVPRSHNNQVPDRSKPRRVSSVFVKEQQMKEEVVARDQWTQIVYFCKVVSFIVSRDLCVYECM